MAASSSKRAAYGDALRARWRRAAAARAGAGDDKENATPSSSARAFDDADPAREVDSEDEWTISDDDDDGSIHRRPRRWDGEVASADAALARGDLDVATKHLLTAIALARVQRTIASATTTTTTATTTTGAPPRRGTSHTLVPVRPRRRGERRSLRTFGSRRISPPRVPRFQYPPSMPSNSV
jgi:hypothetical protein